MNLIELKYKCSRCKTEKVFSEFYKTKNKRGCSVYCIDCTAVSNRERYKNTNPNGRNNYYHRNKTLVKERYQQNLNRSRTMLASAKHRAKENGLPFNIELTDIVIPMFCPILNIELLSAVHWSQSPSIDRIIPELGYVKGNIQVVSRKANVMKNNATPEELKLFADWVNKTYKDKPEAQ